MIPSAILERVFETYSSTDGIEAIRESNVSLFVLELYLATFFLHVISIAFTIVVIAMAGVVIFSKSGQSKGFVITLVVFGALAGL